MDISRINRPVTRRYESVYDSVHMDEPFSIETKDGKIEVDYTYPGWDSGIHVMFPLENEKDPFLMTAAEFRGRYRLQR